MKLSKLFMALGAAATLSFNANAAIPVPAGGAGPFDFSATPDVADWSTLGFGTAAGNVADSAALDAAVALRAATDIITVLGTSATLPPSANEIARRNTAANYLQTRPTNRDYLLLMATLQNTSGASAVGLTVTYDYGVPVVGVEQIPGHQVYYSLDGTAGSWQPIGALSGLNADTPGLSTTVALSSPWADGALLYLLWADDNANGGTEGAYTIDNITFTPLTTGQPTTVTLTAPTNGQVVVKSSILPVNANTTGLIADVQFFLDNVLYSTDTTAPFNAPIDTSTLTLGNHTVRAVATDTSTGTATSQTITFTVVANVPPTIVITNLINGTNFLVGTAIPVQAMTTDDVGVTNVDWFIDGNLFVSRPAPNFSFTYADSLVGSHVIHGVASDSGGLTTMSASVTVNVTNPAANLTVLLANGEEWEYFAAANAPGVDGSGFEWFTPIYNLPDVAGWLVGFAELGGNERVDGIPETTTIDIGPANPRFATVYFRKSFDIPNVAAFASLRLRLLVDDGAVVFLNGNPVWTNNIVVPSIPVPYATLATVAEPSDGLVYQEFNLIDHLLYAQDGPNLLAVEVHQNSLTSSDLSFDAMVWGEMQTPPLLTITSPTNNQTFRAGDSATVNVSVSTFVTNAIVSLNNVVQGSDDVLPFSVVVSNLPVGTHTLKATGSDIFGATGMSAPVTIIVIPNSPPTVSITNVPAGSNLLVGSFIDIGAVAADDASVASVEFYDNGVLRFTDTTAPYGGLMVDFTAGNHSLTARAIDGAGLSTVSAAISIVVTNPPGVTAVLTNRSQWRYIEPAADMPGWETSGFVDTSWALGVGKFGFGGDGETTVIARTNPTTLAVNLGFYFRKQITLTALQLASFASINLQVVRDDGVVVYVNGTEVYRNKMTNDLPVPFNALATTPAIGAPEENTFLNATNLPTSVFTAGVNTIAVEVHQESATSSDVSFDLMLFGNPPGDCPALTITRPTATSARITWPDAGATGCVLYQANSITGPWTLAPAATLNAGVWTLNIANATTPAARFYQLQR